MQKTTLWHFFTLPLRQPYLISGDHSNSPHTCTLAAFCQPHSTDAAGRVVRDPVTRVDVFHSKIETTVPAVRRILGGHLDSQYKYN